MSGSAQISFELNGVPTTVETDPTLTLLTVLREKLLLTGAKRGCNYGVCGACTVLKNGEPVQSCLMLVGTLEGSAIMTIEGLADDGVPNRVQRSFVECGAVQCGFCMPAMVLTAHALLEENPDPTVDEIREAVSGNLCRCSGYVKVIEAVRKAAVEGV